MVLTILPAAAPTAASSRRPTAAASSSAAAAPSRSAVTASPWVATSVRARSKSARRAAASSFAAAATSAAASASARAWRASATSETVARAARAAAVARAAWGRGGGVKKEKGSRRAVSARFLFHRRPPSARAPRNLHRSTRNVHTPPLTHTHLLLQLFRPLLGGHCDAHGVPLGRVCVRGRRRRVGGGVATASGRALGRGPVGDGGGWVHCCVCGKREGVFLRVECAKKKQTLISHPTHRPAPHTHPPRGDGRQGGRRRLGAAATHRAPPVPAGRAACARRGGDARARLPPRLPDRPPAPSLHGCRSGGLEPCAAGRAGSGGRPLPQRRCSHAVFRARARAPFAPRPTHPAHLGVARHPGDGAGGDGDRVLANTCLPGHVDRRAGGGGAAAVAVARVAAAAARRTGGVGDPRGSRVPWRPPHPPPPPPPRVDAASDD